MVDDFSSTNPYRPPLVTSRRLGLSSGQREFLQAIAGCQRGLLFCLVTRAVLEFGFLYWYREYLQPLVVIECVLMLLTAFFVTRSGIRLYGRFSGYYYGFVSITPFLGVFVLLTIDRATTLVLRHFGIRVGWLGASRSDI